MGEENNSTDSKNSYKSYISESLEKDLKNAFESYIKTQMSLKERRQKWRDLENRLNAGDKTVLEDYKKEYDSFLKLKAQFEFKKGAMALELYRNSFIANLDENYLEDVLRIVKTGDERLDHLLPGGIPFGSNVALYGSNLTERDAIINNFVADGLLKHITTICVLTDKSVEKFDKCLDVRMPFFKKNEREDLLHYIDAYPRLIRFKEENPCARRVKSPGDTDGILHEIHDISEKIVNDMNGGRYRLVFNNISPILSIASVKATYNFFSNLVEERKKKPDASMYGLDIGKRKKPCVDKILSLMDGVIEYKTMDSTTFFLVNGFEGARTKGWVKYFQRESSMGEKYYNVVQSEYREL